MVHRRQSGRPWNYGLALLVLALAVKACNSPHIHMFESEEERVLRYEKESLQARRCPVFRRKFGPAQYRVTVDSGLRRIVIDCR